MFCPKGKKALAEGHSPPQDLKESPHSRLYILGHIKVYMIFVIFTGKNPKLLEKQANLAQNLKLC